MLPFVLLIFCVSEELQAVPNRGRVRIRNSRAEPENTSPDCWMLEMTCLRSSFLHSLFPCDLSTVVVPFCSGAIYLVNKTNLLPVSILPRSPQQEVQKIFKAKHSMDTEITKAKVNYRLRENMIRTTCSSATSHNFSRCFMCCADLSTSAKLHSSCFLGDVVFFSDLCVCVTDYRVRNSTARWRWPKSF